MSRNFELMTQIEIEARPADGSRWATADRVGGMKVVPILSRNPTNPSEKEILRMVQRIFLSAKGNAPRKVVLCGVEGDNGSSSVCARAGRALAANCSRPVCLVDANVRSPRLSGMFGVESTNPFCDPSAPLLEQCVKVAGNLWLAGPDILADKGHVLLPRDQLKKRLSQLQEEFEYILIDAPGTGVCGDALLLSLVADAAILVIEANGTRRLIARKAKESFDAAGIRLLGTVLHNRSFPIPQKLYNRL